MNSKGSGWVGLLVIFIGVGFWWNSYKQAHDIVHFDIDVSITGTAKSVDVSVSPNGATKDTSFGVELPWNKGFSADSGMIPAVVAESNDDGNVHIEAKVHEHGNNDVSTFTSDCSGKDCQAQWGGILPHRN